ncbi:tail morphogenetic protein [Staphylococcus phage vB_Sau_Clo6]|nr:tail morphogenetic protein [Staphylococcus phage vB_Sau_Clo6]
MANFLKNLHPLLRRDRNKKDNQDPNFALIEALNEEMNQVEKDAIESKLQSSLKTATSEYLDKFGDWFGVYRKTDEKDDVYRARIIKYLLLKRGTNNAIIEAIKDYLGKDDIDVSVYEPFTNIFYTNKSHLNGEDHLMGYYYRFAVINVSIGDYFPVEIIDVINEFKPAGVTLYVTYDGASTIRGGEIIKWLEGLPKIETYQEFDRFIGYDDTFYGHLNMNQSKDNDNSSSDIFKTNHSLINSLDVLTGSSSVGRQYVNYGYVTSYVYNPSMTSSVNQISSSTEGRGQEVPTDYYMYTSTKNNNTVELNMQTSSGVSYLYNNFNFRDYMSKYRPQVDLQSDEARRIVSDYVKELSIDYYLSAVIPPDESIEIKLQVYDFSINRWLTVSINNLSFYEKNIGSNIGYIKDYLNSELNMFTRLEINAGRKGSVDIKVNYLDLMFYYYERGIYTIKPYKALVENYVDISRDTQVEAFKISSLNNGDIISKSGYQPMQYLRLTDGYDNSINRNLVFNSQDIDRHMQPYSGAIKEVTQSINGYYRVKSTGGSSAVKLLYTLNDIIPYVNETISLSFKIKTHKPVRFYLNGIVMPRDINYYLDSGEELYIKVPETYYAGGSPQIQFRPNGSEDLDFEIKDVKVEVGSKITPYQPNPEDIYGANDPNQNINLEVKDIDSKIINSKDASLELNYKGRNLIQSKKINNNSNLSLGSYVVGDTEKLDVQGWAVGIYSQQNTTDVIKKGETYTISYDWEMLEEPTTTKLNTQNPRIIVYQRPNSATGAKAKKLANTTASSDYAYKHIPVGTKEHTELTFTTPVDMDNAEILVYTGIFTPSGEVETIATRQFSKVRFSNIKIEKGSTSTPYTSAPEDNVQFLDKIITLGNINTKVQSIGITNDFSIPSSSLQYSYYGNDWVTLKDFEKLSQGETITTNNLIDLYGLQTVDYSNITPMSRVSLRSIWNVKLGELNSQEGSLSNMPNDYFNTVWQDIDKLSDIDLGSMRIVKDTEGGVFDGATGEIIKATLFDVGAYTDLDMLAYTLNNYTEPLTLSSSRLISELKEELLTTESLNIDNRVKVIDSISEQLPNNNILSNSYQTQTITQNEFAKYNLKEPIEQRKQYNLRIHGDFKEGLERLAVGNSSGSFNEVFVYPKDIKDGIVDITYTSRDDNYAEGKQRLNNDYRVYAQPYDNGVVTIYSLELIKV